MHLFQVVSDIHRDKQCYVMTENEISPCLRVLVIAS